MLNKLALFIGGGIIFIGLVAVLSVLMAIPTYFLWNWLMPEILAVKTVTFGQAVGINFLTAILFKSQSK